MDQPIEDRIKKIEERQDKTEEKQEDIDKRLAEFEGRQQTEPIKPIDMYQLLLQTNSKLDTIIQAQSGRSEKLETLEQGQQGLKREFHTVFEKLYETLGEHYNDHTERFNKLEETMATKENLKAMATKDDLAKMKEDIIDVIRRYSQPGKN